MLRVKDISFAYGDTPVLNKISFRLKQGEHMAVIGESGSGKSTLLNLIYGRNDLKEGEIWWKEQQVKGPSYNLVVGYDFMKQVTQEFDLMPFTSVAENIGEFLSNFYLEEKARRTLELMKVVELETYADTKVKNLSGGQKQRVALARALAKQPEILLLDEPFSHIDNFKKQSLRRKVFTHLKQEGITCLVATHDKDDVLGFADTLLVLKDQKIIRQGSPEDVYQNPELPLVAAFFGEYNLIDKHIYYAHQIEIVDRSEHHAVVEQCYFNGKNWLLQARYKDSSIFIESTSSYASHSRIKIKLCP